MREIDSDDKYCLERDSGPKFLAVDAAFNLIWSLYYTPVENMKPISCNHAETMRE